MQFRKPQVQKLCVLPPKIVLIEVHFGSEKKILVSDTILCLKKILGMKTIWT